MRQLGLKAQLMSQLNRPDADVQKQALLACSKMMVDSWQFVGSGGGRSGKAKG